MKKIKLSKTLLIPTLGIAAISTIAVLSTSCGRGRVSVVGVSLSETKISLNVGDSKRLEAFVNPDAATDKSVTWTSSNETVATVDKNGNVTAVAVGTATITVTTNDGGKTDTCQVTVEPIHVESVTLNESSIVLEAGNTKTLIATVLPKNATDNSVTWTSSDTNVATVDKNGNVTAVAVGTATITVTTNDGGKTDTCQVTVEPIHVESVTLNESSVILEAAGETKTLIATVLPENATDKSVTWTSSDTNVATVDKNGNVTAVGNGTTIITVTTNDGHYEDTCEVIVTLPYVYVEANADSTLELVNDGDNNPNLQYSIDGKNWTIYNQTLEIPANQTLYLKGDNPSGWSHSGSVNSYLNLTGNVDISGKIMSLLDNGKGTATAIPNEYCFYSLFKGSTGITSVSKDFLPATTLAESCYSRMFHGCTSLTQAPDLPATKLADYCYNGMFGYCSSLTTAPDLPATKLADYCYTSMFRECGSLTIAPDLPATTLAESCYSRMFHGCTSLTQAPDLPATELADYCYASMFRECGSLTIAPDLPATELADYCYSGMFQGCSSLNSIRISYTGTVAEAPSDAFTDWVEGVANTGTFYYKGNDACANFGFPEDWTVNPLLTNNKLG